MKRSTKISIAINEDQLLRARQAAESEGMSLSAYIGRALGKQIEDQKRLDAARALHAIWGPDSLPSADDRREFIARMARRHRRRAKAA